jgi:hypothetical protein
MMICELLIGYMRILVLGALGPYPERLYHFMVAGHQLWFVSTLALLPQERLEGVPTQTLWDLSADAPVALEKLVELIASENIKVVYSLLNTWDGSNWATAALLQRGCPVPIVRHYKEHYLAPNDDERVCIERSTGVLFINPESRDYFASAYHLPLHTACIDADLIPGQYLSGTLQPKLSAQDGRPHLLIAGTAMIDGGRYDYRELVRILTGLRAHVHLYAQFRHMDQHGLLYYNATVEEAYRSMETGGYLHVHPLIPAARFVEEWSRYDAGLMHVARPDDRFRVLNIPNRYSAYLAAGLPVALPAGQMAAMQHHLEKLNVAIPYNSGEDLVARLPDPAACERALAIRESQTFDAIFPHLMAFIHACVP